jgi:ribosomal protein L11 methylase PrmA
MVSRAYNTRPAAATSPALTAMTSKDKRKDMRALKLVLTCVLALAFLGGCAAAPATTSATTSAPVAPKLDVIWVPTPPEVITVMLDAAKVGPNDVLYDLGCGEGEIVIAAAQKYGARAVGVDLDPERLRNARIKAASAGVANRVTFIEQDLFKTDVSPATVVTLYLLPELNERLRPTLLNTLRPGTRIVSHDFAMGDWAPERTIEVPLTRTHRVMLWRVPKRAP